MVRSACAAIGVLFLSASAAFAQQCSIGGPNTINFACNKTAINVGGSTTCTMTVMNTGPAACTGTFTGAVGVFDPGTVSNGVGFGAAGSCSIVLNYQLPPPYTGLINVPAAFVCQSTGMTLAAGASYTVSADLSPSSSAPMFNLGSAYSFQSAGGGGTAKASGYATDIIAVQNCTAVPVVAGAAPSTIPYVVQWNATGDGGPYVIDESTLPDFSVVSTVNEPSTSHVFQHTVSTPTTYYYRVRPLICGGSPGTSGPRTQIVILPQQAATSRDFDIITPIGTISPINQDVAFSGLTPGRTFSVTTDRPFLTVNPSSGTVKSDGTVTVTVTATPSGTFPIGASTGTVILTVSSSKGSAVPNDSRGTSTTVSISLATPVNANPRSGAGSDELIVPAVAHLEGSAVFRSDIRITNVGSTAATYLLSFTPQNSDGTQTGKQTTITVQPNETVALNDVLKDFFGFAMPADQAGGVLDIRVITGSPLTTYVSSRTYALDPVAGTYGQFIPAVPASKFLKNGAGTLTLTQVSEATAFHTNIGLVEGLGQSVAGRLRVFSTANQLLGEFPFSLRPFEFQQLSSFLASKGITASDARVDAVVDSATGSVSTYASVLDNTTKDPLLVSPIQAANLSANRYVLPGMADLNAGTNFHSDIRIYNASNLPVTATATYYPQNNGTPVQQTASIATGEIKAYNNVLPTLFGQSNSGGAIVVTTPANTPLIVSGRTYSNAAAGGTYGQFIPAVTPADGVGVSDGPLQILQLEQSANFRSNVGLNELTGNPGVTTVQVSAIVDGSKVAASTNIDLQPNEFRQLTSVLNSLNVGNTYNARVMVKVISGNGRVTAYGSVVDNNTSDPTYVPAQK